MLKKVLFLLCISLLGMSLIKPGQLKKIVSCNVKLDPNDIYPGNIIEMVLNTKLSDSTVIRSSASSFTVNYADYNFEIEGGVTIQEKSRTKLVVRILDDSYRSPYVRFSAKLKRKGAVKWEVKLPINYDVVQAAYYAGKNGFDPRANSDNGFKKIPVTKRVNIEFIDNEQTLSNNSDPKIIGEKGPDLDVYLSLIGEKGEEQFLQVEIRDEFGGQRFKYLKLGVGSLEIQSIGGKGGISKSGGKGGNGGNVTVFIKPEAKTYFKQIFIVNYGGEGGELWRPKIDGQQQGPFGDDGEVTIVKWEN